MDGAALLRVDRRYLVRSILLHSGGSPLTFQDTDSRVSGYFPLSLRDFGKPHQSAGAPPRTKLFSIRLFAFG
jgi:hypothetical protein